MLLSSAHRGLPHDPQPGQASFGQKGLTFTAETSSEDLADSGYQTGRKNKRRIDSSGLNHFQIQGKAISFNKQNILDETVGVLLLQMLCVNQNLLKLLQKHSTISQNKHLCVSLPG